MKENKAKVTVKTGHTTAQIKGAKLALSGIVTNGGKLIQFFRDAYTFNRLNAKSETSDFSKVNSACYAELQVSEKSDANGYNVAKVQASKAKAEIKPSAKAKATKKAEKPSKPELVTTPAEKQEAMHKADPKACVLNLATVLARDAKLNAKELEVFFSAQIIAELKKRKIVK